MPDFYNKKYFLTMEKNYLTRIDKIRFFTIVDFIQRIKPKIVLDAGCGSGDYLLYLAKTSKKIYGIDFSEMGCRLSINKTKKFNNVFIKKADLSKKLIFRNSYFDFILCTEVLEHIKDISSVLSEFKRILKNNGLILFTLPNFTTLSVENLREKFFYKDPTHYHRYSLAKWIKLISKFFKILEMKTTTHYSSIMVFYLGFQKNIINIDKITSEIPLINKLGREIFLLCQKK